MHTPNRIKLTVILRVSFAHELSPTIKHLSSTIDQRTITIQCLDRVCSRNSRTCVCMYACMYVCMYVCLHLNAIQALTHLWHC